MHAKIVLFKFLFLFLPFESPGEITIVFGMVRIWQSCPVLPRGLAYHHIWDLETAFSGLIWFDADSVAVSSFVVYVINTHFHDSSIIVIRHIIISLQTLIKKEWKFSTSLLINTPYSTIPSILVQFASCTMQERKVNKKRDHTSKLDLSYLRYLSILRYAIDPQKKPPARELIRKGM